MGRLNGSLAKVVPRNIDLTEHPEPLHSSKLTTTVWLTGEVCLGFPV